MIGPWFERERHEEARQELHAIEARVLRQRDALVMLTAEKINCDELPATLARILEVTSATLEVDRVSIWRYNAQGTRIECLDLFDRRSGRHSRGNVLTQTDCPAYFHALGEADVIAADDAVNDPRTSAFTDDYLLPFGITSMLDVPIRLRGAVIGVLCSEHTGAARRWTDDEKTFVIAISNLISLALERCERSRAETEVMLQSAALNAAANAVVITDWEGVVVWANPAFTALTGYMLDEAVGRPVRDLLKSSHQSPEFYADMWRTLIAGRVWSGELMNRRKDGSTYPEYQTITPVRTGPGDDITHFVAVKRDLTAHRNLENQFLQAQKMEVVGRLAGGIAHDFNNMLTVINGLAEIAIGDLDPAHPVRHDLEQIHESGLRAASLTRQLLTFSRKQITVRQPLVVARTLEEFRGILQRLIGEDIALEINAECGRATVIADQSQFEQVILNLAVNARDAMPQGGHLRINAVVVDVDDDEAAVSPGSYVKVTVADTGIGMSRETVAKIFEPFFTTKEAGKGTGLGLSTVYAIVAHSGGAIDVTSERGAGTTFTLLWPRTADAMPNSDQVARLPASRGTETVLVVEDDDSVREFAVRVLRGAGYRALTASNATAAIKLLRIEPWPIDLLVTDVVLPGSGGRELATAACVIRPQLRVLYTSGYTDDTVLAHGVEQQVMSFLPKPYTPASLLNQVRSVLKLPMRGHS